MSAAASDYRLDGIYKQRQDDFFMQRVKLPAGVISSTQARIVAEVSTRFGQGTIHLTSRGSIEIHWLKEADLPQIKRELAKAGLTSRGACGGAVRGITCGSQGALGFPMLESLARRLQRHFAGNPRFERLPKKFKIGIEADVAAGKHLIQDVGLVLAKLEGEKAYYDVWIAGGLGREPRPGFLLIEQIAEERIIPIIEAVLAVYATHAPPPKRLKYLSAEFGEEKLRQLIEAEAAFSEIVPEVSGMAENLLTEAGDRQRLELPVFAGKLTAAQLKLVADAADRIADGIVLVTVHQDFALLLAPGVAADAELLNLRQSSGLPFDATMPVLRVCPGNHECRMGLVATREVAAEILPYISTQPQTKTWAISGCHNSCSQPQLADVGIVTARLAADADGKKSPRFDVYRRSGSGFGEKEHGGLTRQELVDLLQHIA
jgi:ferredoxin-nitrite reductase